jgi:hypothetical protein
MPELLYSEDYGGTSPSEVSREIKPQTQPNGGGQEILYSQNFGGTAPEIVEEIQQAPPAQQMPPEQIQPEQPQEPAEEEPGFWASFGDVFSGNLRETEETNKVRELAMELHGMTENDPEAELKIASALYLVGDEEAKKDVIRENIPGVKIYDNKKGTTIIETPDGKKAVLNQPGLSYQDFVGSMGQLFAFLPSTKAASMANTIAKKIAVGGATSAATEYGLQKGAQQIGSKQEVSPGMVALSGGLGALGETVVPVVKGLKQARQAKKLGVAKEELKEAAKLTKEADVLTKETGIPLFQAQQTLDPAALEKQSFVATLTGGSKKAARELKIQNRKAFDAVENAINKISPPRVVESAAGRIKTASQAAIDAKKAIRAEKASPLYAAARADKTKFVPKETRSTINQVKADYPEGGNMAKLMGRIDRLIGKGQEGQTVQKLHGAKLEIDDMLSKFGEGSLGNTEKRELMKVKNILLDEMDEVSPSYKEAREIFSKNTPAIQELEDSIIGKISKLDDTQLKSVTGKLFDPAETNTEVIRKARKVIEEIDPQAWRDITRTELERRIGSVKVDLGKVGETVENVPGQLYRAIFGNTKQRKILYAGLDKDTAKNIKYLEEGLKRASLGRPGGSQTATREEIKKELKGGIGNAIRKIFTPVKSFAEVGESAAFDKRVRAMAELMYNPQWKPKLKELTKIHPNSPKAAKLFNELMKESEKVVSRVPQLAKPTDTKEK